MALSLLFVLLIFAGISVRALHLPSLESPSSSVSDACTSKKAYCEAARPRFHFTASTNWLNDPNGLHYYNGVYHMFFQHTHVKDWDEKMAWGHAVSEDLLHWHQLPNAIEPKDGGAWSGSAVVDHANTSGLQTGKDPVVVAIYTHMDYTPKDGQSSQRLVFSNDGSKNMQPLAEGDGIVIPAMDGHKNGARDPKVFWHDASKQWVLVLWERDGHTGLYTSKNLRSWKKMQDIQVDGFECPDFFELQVKGEGTRRWVLWFASSKYYIGTFNGFKFDIEGEARTAEYGAGYAPQTFDNLPNGRRVQIAWVQWFRPVGPSQKDLPFDGSMSIPMEMDLIRGPDKTLRVRRLPVAEVAKKLWQDLPAVSVNAIRKISGSKLTKEAQFQTSSSGLGLDISIEVQIEPESSLLLAFSGHKVTLTRGKVEVHDSAPAPGTRSVLPLEGGSTKLRLLADRSSLEIFDLDGGTSMATVPVTSPCWHDKWVTQISLTPSGSVSIADFQVHELSDKYSLCQKFAAKS